ncbi:MAG: LPS export ABC transporter protein LptC/lipopolysaccharide transport protein LptA [Enterobacterales bacterium]|jgi:LPS export ABC transporter protein LptC/lipopolysaccharide transport protein LptA
MIRLLNIAVVLFLIWFLNASFQQEQINSISATEIVGTENTPDFYSEKLEIRQYNEEGSLASYITTERLSHYLDSHSVDGSSLDKESLDRQNIKSNNVDEHKTNNQYALLDAPSVLIYGKDGGTKKITSTNGLLTERNHDLKLSNDVVLLVSDKNDNQTLKVTTTELSYNDVEDRIWTDKEIIGNSEQATFNSNKLQLDVKSEQLNLKDKVKIHYDKYGLDISADALSSNPLTELSRLNGNVLLSHVKILITGKSAEVKTTKSKQQQQFIISGAPVNFQQILEQSTMFAKANHLVYIPSSEQMEFEGNVVITQRSVDVEFEVAAEQLQLLFQDQKPSQLIAEGSPVKFKHKIAERIIYIDAKHMLWQSTTKMAILSQATVQDGETIFSADEIQYNTLTGEISATGNGNSRPSYKYKPEEEKGSN